jgi:hypothetical protein
MSQRCSCVAFHRKREASIQLSLLAFKFFALLAHKVVRLAKALQTSVPLSSP